MTIRGRQPLPEGECIRRQLRTNAAFRALGDLTSFQQGGCWIAARAIQLQYGGKLMVVRSSHGAEHVVVERGGLYYDSEGAQTEKQLLDRMRQEFNGLHAMESPRIESYRREDLDRRDIPVDGKKARAVQVLLSKCSRPRRGP